MEYNSVTDLYYGVSLKNGPITLTPNLPEPRVAKTQQTITPTTLPSLRHRDSTALMAPINFRNGHHCQACNNIHIHSSRQVALDEDIIALELAQEELKFVSQSVEQLLDVMRNGDGQQLETLFAAARSGVSQDEILAMARQFTRGKEREDPK
ncbi:hypothetical protein TSTA_020530 [Talaromyces stipitatus ATCC 10500]|uniref:Uncharacterized protein n=1 Tax=Talaromyces stipitatus (strain ATCC 10500 / CBS 375.48 / QM 6759 / NRRL 1006) TaxID=441959 RepID=B8MFK6_TALSN|nr:uncharacterized protein TSTA_020530 [Talaromyces stipitatus ATCC 10500]EED16996.1 hypothetical protein TSTA_020530 [Talaromyces stipitatus ATCC 10500]